MDSTEPDDSSLDARARIRLRLQAAELIATAGEAADPAERERLFAEAHALIARADRNATRNGRLH